MHRQINTRKIMDTLFKEVRHVNDSVRCYDLKGILENSDWDKKIPAMSSITDLAVLEKCWTSILYELPITLVTVGYKSDTDMVILDNFREVDALMSIYGYNPRNEHFYVDVRSCELTLESSEDTVELKDVRDTFSMSGIIENVRSQSIADDEKEVIIDNIRNINAKLQRFEIALCNLLIPKYEKSRLVSMLNQFYKDLYAYI